MLLSWIKAGRSVTNGLIRKSTNFDDGSVTDSLPLMIGNGSVTDSLPLMIGLPGSCVLSEVIYLLFLQNEEETSSPVSLL